MYKIAKALHFLGLAMFLGSILGHICVGFVPGAKDRAEAMLFGRQTIEIATWSLTIPGLALLAATGLFIEPSWRARIRAAAMAHRASDNRRPDPAQRRICLGAGRKRPPPFGVRNCSRQRIDRGLCGAHRAGNDVWRGQLGSDFVTVFLAVLKPGLGQSRN